MFIRILALVVVVAVVAVIAADQQTCWDKDKMTQAYAVAEPKCNKEVPMGSPERKEGSKFSMCMLRETDMLTKDGLQLDFPKYLNGFMTMVVSKKDEIKKINEDCWAGASGTDGSHKIKSFFECLDPKLKPICPGEMAEWDKHFIMQ